MANTKRKLDGSSASSSIMSASMLGGLVSTSRKLNSQKISASAAAPAGIEVKPQHRLRRNRAAWASGGKTMPELAPKRRLAMMICLLLPAALGAGYRLSSARAICGETPYRENRNS